MLADELHANLEQLDAEHQRRRRRVIESPQSAQLTIDGREYLSFCSNDYLGLANHPQVKQAFIEGVRRWGVGAGSAHLIAGHTRAHHDLEEALAAFLGRERALLFSSGYQANLGVISALLQSGDQLVQDKLNHASLIDAAKLAEVRLRRFPHGNHQRADELLRAANHEAAERRCLLATDGVFSMDGDIAPLPELAAACREQDAILLIDDAHGIGVLGEHGRGSVSRFGLGPADVPVLIGTLGKAFGTAGAFVAGDAPLIEYLINRARTYVFTTAQPPAVAAASLQALELLWSEDWRRERIQALSKSLIERARALGLKVLPSDSAIHALVIGASADALWASSFLQQRGILIPAIRPPTVPEGSARLRISVTAAHSDEQLTVLIDALAEMAVALRERAH